MKTQYFHIRDFRRDSTFYEEIPLLVTIKSFDLQAIRSRYLTTRGKKSQRTGSTGRRDVAVGGVASLLLQKGALAENTVMARMKEPRGIDIKQGRIAVSSENQIFIIDKGIMLLEDPWFSYIHTVDFRRDGKRLLVSSSGFDAIMEYAIDQKPVKTYEWFAWEHGFDHGLDPQTGKKVFLTRHAQLARQWKKEGKAHIFVENPGGNSLPTARRAAFINSVVYDGRKNNHLIATFFHEGKVFSIDQKTGDTKMVLENMKSPHGGRRINDEAYMATNTKGGEVVLGAPEKAEQRFLFDGLPGKPEPLADFEWIQNAACSGEHIVAIDSNRNCFVVINLKKKVFDMIPFPQNWAVQDLVPGKVTSDQKELLMQLDRCNNTDN